MENSGKLCKTDIWKNQEATKNHKVLKLRYSEVGLLISTGANQYSKPTVPLEPLSYLLSRMR